MNDQDDLERRLAAWLTETARPMPPDLLDDIVATAPRVQRPGIRATFRSGRRLQVAVGAVAAAVVLAVGVGAALRPPVLPGATGTPMPSVGPSPTDTPGPSFPPATGTPEASIRLGEWHRNNYNAGEEQLLCREGTSSWTCDYVVPDGSGLFEGQNVTDAWTCPAWFPSTICDNVTAVYHGVLVLFPPGGETPGPFDRVSQDYVVTDVAGQAVLQLFWVDQFVCPWYRTFEEALAADYNCVFAP
jgi:hypothetical protein